MSERYLQSLAILLAGLFSAERARSKRLSLGLPLPSTEEGPDDTAAERGKENEH